MSCKIEYKEQTYTQAEFFAYMENNPREFVQMEQTFTGYESILNKLSAKFGIKWTVDNDQPSLGRYQDGVIYINSNKIKPDTPFHEFAHPFEQTLKIKNYGLWKRLAEKASSFTYNNTNLEKFVSSRYPELSGDDLLSEIIVTAIGLASADSSNFSEQVGVKGLINTIIEWLSKYLGNLVNKDRLAGLSTNTTIKELAELLQNEEPISVFPGKGTFLQTESALPESLVQKLIDLNKDVDLNEDDLSNTFYTKAGKQLARATEWVSKTFSSENKKALFAKKTPAEFRAVTYYRTHGNGAKVGENIKYAATGQEVTYEQLLVLLQEEINNSRKVGQLIHAKVELYIKENTGQPTTKVKERIEQLYEETGKTPFHFKYLNSNRMLELLANDLGLQIGAKIKQEGKDNIISELKIASELLGIGTTIDMLVEHTNGAFSIFDFKTGNKFYDDSNTVDQFAFSKLLDDVLKDTNLTKAKMEIMLRAFMIKEQLPEAKFRDLAVVHIGVNQKTRKELVSMYNYLQVLENYFKAERTDIYQQLKEKGLFEYTNYTSEDASISKVGNMADYKNKTIPEQIETAKAQIEQIRNKFAQFDEQIPKSAQQEINQLTNFILNLSKDFSEDYLREGKDMGLLERWFGSPYDMSNPIIQKFVRLFNKFKQTADHEYHDIKEKQRHLLSKVIEDYKKDNIFKSKLNKWSPIGSIQYHTKDNTGLYDFMVVRDTVADSTGWFARIITEKDVKDGTYTENQYNYNKWYRETLKSLYNNTMLQESFDGKTKEEIWRGKGFYNDRFIPRVPMSTEEGFERYGFNPLDKQGRKAWEMKFKSMSDFFILEQYKDDVNNRIGLPVKYTGSSSIIATENHSLNMEEAMLKFAQTMIYKKHLDPAYALGKGVLSLFKTDYKLPNGKSKFPRSEAYIQSYLDTQVAQKQEEIELTRDSFTAPKWFPYWGGKSFNPHRTLQFINNYFSKAMMWWKPVGGLYFALLMGATATRMAASNAISKLFGVETDFNFKDFWEGMAIFTRSGVYANKKAFMLDDKYEFEKNDKMHRFVELMAYDTNFYKGTVAKEDLLSAKNQLMTDSIPYWFYSVGAEGAAYSTMIALLKGRKLKDGTGSYIKINEDKSFTKVDKDKASSMWEAYEVQTDGSFKYIGPTRGLLEDGTELKGLTSDEINKFRRVSQRLHGSYREDEKMSIEANFVGKWLMKFRRYLPMNLAYNYQGKSKDWSIGDYKALMQWETQPDGSRMLVPKLKDGMTIYEWQSQMNQGRIWVMANFLKACVSFKMNKTWSTYSEEQKRLIIDGAINFVMCATLYLAVAGAYGDDEEKKKKSYKRWLALNHHLAQIDPKDILNVAANPFTQTKGLKEVLEAGYEFFVDGVIMGETIKTGEHAGNLVGSTVLGHKLYPFNVVIDFQDYMDEDHEFLEGR